MRPSQLRCEQRGRCPRQRVKEVLGRSLCQIRTVTPPTSGLNHLVIFVVVVAQGWRFYRPRPHVVEGGAYTGVGQAPVVLEVAHRPEGHLAQRTVVDGGAVLAQVTVEVRLVASLVHAEATFVLLGQAL